MCSIFGAVLSAETRGQSIDQFDVLEQITTNANARGRDGAGFWLSSKDGTAGHRVLQEPSRIAEFLRQYSGNIGNCTVIGNYRAEPTTEYTNVKGLTDQQPYCLNDWAIVHNGTVANDKVLRTGQHPTKIDSAAILEQLEYTAPRNEQDAFTHFIRMVNQLEGSFAIAASHTGFEDVVFLACNYRPIWVAFKHEAAFFASSRHMFPDGVTPTMIPPYSAATLSSATLHVEPILREENRRALVVCSGGLDSVTAATKMVRDGYDVTLAHFTYGCRAQAHEVNAVAEVAKFLNVPMELINMGIYKRSDSPLLDHNAQISGGESGAEFAHEWVPARNLVMLSLATSFAEANGFSYVVLGNNMEEAGAYPDNEPEFIDRFNDILDFAVGVNKKIRVLQPVGNLMKHEIVKLAHEIGAPMHLTWSCYRNEDKHCGKCGPCYMRAKAFKINGLKEVIEYEQDPDL